MANTAHRLESPVGLLSDEETAVSPVLESTLAECGAGLHRALLPDFSAISANHEQVRLVRYGTKKLIPKMFVWLSQTGEDAL